MRPVELPDASFSLLAAIRLLLRVLRLPRRLFTVLRALPSVARVLGVGDRPVHVADAVDADWPAPMCGVRWPIDWATPVRDPADIPSVRWSPSPRSSGSSASGAYMAAMAFLAFFWSASLPLVETLTFDHLRENAARYSRVQAVGGGRLHRRRVCLQGVARLPADGRLALVYGRVAGRHRREFTCCSRCAGA